MKENEKKKTNWQSAWDKETSQDMKDEWRIVWSGGEVNEDKEMIFQFYYRTWILHAISM